MPQTASPDRALGVVLKACVVISCLAGIATHGATGDSGLTGSLFKAFTIQSNACTAIISGLFLAAEGSGRTLEASPCLSAVKYMFTTSILLTWLVFSVLLAPAMSIGYLTSASNILLHTIAPMLAMADFLNSRDALKEDRVSLLLPLVMPLAYALYFFSSYSITGKMPVPYFFLDYVRFGWFRIGSSGIGVAYWMAVLMLMLVLLGRAILRLRRLASARSVIVFAAAAMAGLSLATSLVSAIR